MLRLIRSTALWILALPYALAFVGAATNQIAMNANGDLMPVRINVVKAIDWFGTPIEFGQDHGDEEHHIILLPNGVAQLDDRHCLMTSQTRYNWLSDLFDFHSSIMSVGDLLLELAEWMYVPAFFVWITIVCEKVRRP